MYAFTLLQKIFYMRERLPLHQINMGQNSELDEMMMAIERFYPLNHKMENGLFLGYRELCDILYLKNNQLAKGAMPKAFELLVTRLQKEFDGFEIIKETERQFPNYAVSIELSNKDSDDLITVKSLRLRISLLTSFFTIFHEDTILHKGILDFTQAPVTTALVSSHSMIVDEQGLYLDRLKAITEKIFPDYQFVGHYLLFAIRLKNAVPYGFPGSLYGADFPLYNFLFDYDFFNPALTTVVS